MTARMFSRLPVRGRHWDEIVFLAVALFAWAAVADDSPRWRWSHPRPHGNNVVDMIWSEAFGMVVQVAERGQIYTSSDLEAWLPQESGTGQHLRAVTVLGQRILVTGAEGTVLYADAGGSFQPGTLVDGATTNWLEGVAASSTLAVAVGDNGAIYSTPDGIHWKRQDSGTNAWLRGVAAGNNRFVAVGERGCVLTSPDGTNWMQRPLVFTNHLNRIRYDGSLFTVVGEGGSVLTSADGSSWRTVWTGATGALYDSVRSGRDRLILGDQEVRLSVNGSLVWSDQLSGSGGPPLWTYYAAVASSNGFLIAGSSGMMAEATPATLAGYAWTAKASLWRNWLWDVVWVPDLFVAVGDRGTVLTSADGVGWSLEYPPLAFTNAVFLGVGGTTNLLVAAGSQGALAISPADFVDVIFTNESGVVVTQAVSTLGVVWREVSPPPVTNDLQGVTFHDGRYWVVGGQGVVLSSTNGSAWSRGSAPTPSFLSSIAGYPDGLVATGDDGTIVRSSDGSDWSLVPSETSNWLYRVRFLNGQLIALGQNGFLATSTNGLAWTPRDTGTSNWLNDVAWVGGRFWAVGAQGTVLASPDAVSWAPAAGITLKAMYGAATDSQRLIAVGLEGAILRSPIVADPTPIEILSYSRALATNGMTVESLLLFGGHTDQRFTLDYGSGIESNAWITGPRLEFYDPSATLYYLESVALTNAPPREFYRATLLP